MKINLFVCVQCLTLGIVYFVHGNMAAGLIEIILGVTNLAMYIMRRRMDE